MQLTSEWLSSDQADSLAQQLLGLWKEQGPGGPICFTWTDWLQNDALPFLGITDTLLLKLDPHAMPAVENGIGSLAAEERRLEPSQSNRKAAELAYGSKLSADSSPSSGSASQQLSHSNACQEASCSASTPRTGHVNSRQHADSLGESDASMASSKPVCPQLDTEHANEGIASNSDAGRSGRRKHRGSPQMSPAKALDPRAAAWQPQDGLEAPSLPKLAPAQHLRHHLQKQAPGPSRHTEQAVPDTAATAPATAHRNSKAKLREKSSSTHTDAEDRQNRYRATESVESGAGASSAAGASQPVSSGSDLERVVQLYLHLTAYSKSRERELFQEASPQSTSLYVGYSGMVQFGF